MNYDDEMLSQACLKSEHFHKKYKTQHIACIGPNKTKFGEYMDKMNEKITSKDINKNHKLQSTLNLDKRQDDPLISIKQKNKHISTVLSQYNDKIDANGKVRPVTMKNKLWKTANRRRFGFAPQYHSKKPIK